MLSIHCEFCGEDLVEPGGILLSPPYNKIVIKRHLCCSCYEKAYKLLVALNE